jgi:galactan 5-O-arabinofuranosyltransferase
MAFRQPSAGPDAPLAMPHALSAVSQLPSITGRLIRRKLGEMVLAIAMTVVVSLAIQFLVDHLRIPKPSFVTVAMTSLISVTLLVGALWLVARERFSVAANVVTWAGLATLNTAVLSLMLHGTKFYLGGISSDQSFRTEYVTRLADSSKVADFAFVDLPAYYPPGWFWLAGRFADLFHLDGWASYKPFAICTVAAGSVLAYVAWSLLVPRRIAVLLSLAVSTVGVATWAAYEPYAWLFGSVIPPMTCVAWKYLGDAAPEGSRIARSEHLAPGVLLGGYVGFLGLFYTLLCVFFCMVMTLVTLVGPGLRWRSPDQLWSRVRHAGARLALVALVALSILAVHWVPYLLVSSHTPVEQSAALRILPQFGAQFPVPVRLGDFVGVLSLAGLVWAVVRSRDSEIARVLLLVIAAGYLWYGLSMLSIPAGLTLLPYKVELAMDEVLRCAGVFAIVDVTRWLYHRVADCWRRTTLLAICTVSALGFVGIFQNATDALNPLPGNAYSDYYPTGYTALGHRDPTQQGAWNQHLHDTIAALTHKSEHDLVVLSTYQDFLSFWPYWNLETSVTEYANPLADFNGRRWAVENWAKSDSADALLAKIQSSAFRAPDVFVFSRHSDDLHMAVTRNIYPIYPQIDTWDVVFPAKLFDSPAFTRRDVGPFSIVVRH